MIDFKCEENKGVINFLSTNTGRSSAPLAETPAKFDRPWYEGLGTHPELIERLWEEITTDLPKNCKWIVYARPILVHPGTGVIFGFAVGAYKYALWLPPQEYEAAAEIGLSSIYTDSRKTVIDLKEIGAGWIFGNFKEEERGWCVKAYEAVGMVSLSNWRRFVSFVSVTQVNLNLLKRIAREDQAEADKAFKSKYDPFTRSVELVEKAAALDQTQEDLSLLLMLEALRLDDNGQVRTGLFNSLNSIVSLRFTLSGHLSAINDLLFSRAEDLLVSVGTDAKIFLWSIRNREQIAVLNGHTSSVNALSLSNDNKLLASGSRDNTVIIWNLVDYTQCVTITDPPYSVLSLDFNSSGHLLAIGSGGCDILIWGIHEQRVVIQLAGHSSFIKCVRFSPDGKVLASASGDGKVIIWDVHTQNVITTLTKLYSDSLDFSCDGKLLAIGIGFGEVVLVETSSYQIVNKLEGSGGSVRKVVFSPDNKMIACVNGDNIVKLWNIQSDLNNPLKLSGHQGEVWCLDFTSDSKILASGSTDHAIICWNTDVED